MTTLPPSAPPPRAAGSFLVAFVRGIMHPPKVARGRYVAAMVVALVADLLFWWLGEALPVASDFVVAAILAFCLGGLRIEILLAFLGEAVPGVGLLPCWSLAVPILWMRASGAQPQDQSPSGTTSTGAAASSAAAQGPPIHGQPASNRDPRLPMIDQTPTNPRTATPPPPSEPSPDA